MLCILIIIIIKKGNKTTNKGYKMFTGSQISNYFFLLTDLLVIWAGKIFYTRNLFDSDISILKKVC